MRDLLVVKVMADPEKILNTSSSNLEKMRALSQKASQEKIINALNLLNESIISAKNVAFKRTVYELALVKMCDVTTSDTIDALLARVAELEEKLQNGNFTVAPPKKEEQKNNEDNKQKKAPKTEPKEKIAEIYRI